MPDPKHSPREQGTVANTAESHIRPHQAEDVVVPKHAVVDEAEGAVRAQIDAFLDDWALRHFTISVKLHDVARVSEGDVERQAVLEDLGVVQGILLEVHDFVTADERVRAIMRESLVLQNGVGALYGWLDEVLDAAARLRVTRNKPGFVDESDEALGAILRTLERVHPDLELLLRVDTLGIDEDVARKIALCFRQIGAAVVRVSGRAGSSYPGRMT
jgi:hypothetical protein